MEQEVSEDDLLPGPKRVFDASTLRAASIEPSVLPRSDVERFRENCRKANIEPGKPLYMVLSTAYHAAVAAQESARGAARGLTPEGESDLIQRLERQAQASLRESMAKHRIRLGMWTSVAMGVALVACLGLGAAVGYWRGLSEGQGDIQRVSQDLAVAFRYGPESAEAASRLLRDNDVMGLMADCKPFVVDGRRACAGAFWLEPAPVVPPAVK
jgi:hypothetical protein